MIDRVVKRYRSEKSFRDDAKKMSKRGYKCTVIAGLRKVAEKTAYVLASYEKEPTP
jgi:hypothetical protein